MSETIRFSSIPWKPLLSWMYLLPERLFSISYGHSMISCLIVRLLATVSSSPVQDLQWNPSGPILIHYPVFSFFHILVDRRGRGWFICFFFFTCTCLKPHKIWHCYGALMDWRKVSFSLLFQESRPLFGLSVS